MCVREAVISIREDDRMKVLWRCLCMCGKYVFDNKICQDIFGKIVFIKSDIFLSINKLLKSLLASI